MLILEFFYVNFRAFYYPEEINLYVLSITVNSAIHSYFSFSREMSSKENIHKRVFIILASKKKIMILLF